MIEDLMQQLVEGGGDLHIAGTTSLRTFQRRTASNAGDQLTEEACNRLIFSMLNNGQRKTLEQTWELDCACPQVARSRQRIGRGAAMPGLRALGSNIPAPNLEPAPCGYGDEQATARPRSRQTDGIRKTTTLAHCWITSITPAANTSTIEDQSNSFTRATRASYISGS